MQADVLARWSQCFVPHGRVTSGLASFFFICPRRGIAPFIPVDYALCLFLLSAKCRIFAYYHNDTK